MNVNVKTESVLPPTTVVLELDLAEFAAVYRCVYCHFDGPLPGVRNRVENGFLKALEGMSPEWQRLVRAVRGGGDGKSVAEAVNEAFARVGVES